MADRRRVLTPPARATAVVASAAVMTQRPESMRKLAPQADWQNEAWAFYDNVGELRFGIGWLANGMSRVNLVAARQPDQLGDEPSAILAADPDDPDAVPLTDAEQMAVDLVTAIAGGADGQGQLLAECCVQLSVPGIGYVLMTAEPLHPSPPHVDPPTGITPVPNDEYLEPTPDESWAWQVLAYDEVRSQGDRYEIAVGPSEWLPMPADSVLVKVWRPHPRRGWEPDSPCRAVRSVLRQITLLDDHVQATAQSRLAGAGLLVLPAEAEFVPLPTPGQAAPAAEQSIEQEDDFVDVLVQTMTLPLTDRASAAAVVPLTVRIPGEFVDKVRHVTFWSEFSDNVLPLRESAVKRLALGMDMPPEVLTGVSGMNHWGAWQVAEEAVTLHIEPMSEIITHAITLGYLRPAMEAAGYGEVAGDFLIWYDATDLTVRPDRSTDTIAAYDRIEASGAALRRESGLSEDDAPSAEERTERMQRLLLTDPTLGPSVASELGLFDGDDNGPPTGPAEDAPDEETAPEEGEPIVSDGALLEACDGLVYRALERAGGRLRSAAGRKVNGGAAAVAACSDTADLHVVLGGIGQFASLDHLLDGAWDRCPTIAQRCGVPSSVLETTLDSYVRALLTTGHHHDVDRLADALGLGASV